MILPSDARESEYTSTYVMQRAVNLVADSEVEAGAPSPESCSRMSSPVRQVRQGKG